MGCDLGGYNSNRFDVPLLVEEFLRCGINFPEPTTNMIDVFKIFTINEQRTLEAAVKFYCDKELEDAHSAEADINATIDVFEAQLERYELPSEVNEIDKYCMDGARRIDFAGCLVFNEEMQITFGFGKHKGKLVKDNLDYVDWMLRSDFTMDTKNRLRAILKSLR